MLNVGKLHWQLYCVINYRQRENWRIDYFNFKGLDKAFWSVIYMQEICIFISVS